jgi:VWFA-related protein
MRLSIPSFLSPENRTMRSTRVVFTPLVVILGASLLCPPLSGQGSPSATPTLSVYTREVAVDVNVTDAKGNAIHALTRDNFTVLEDGKPMTLRSFREHRGDKPEADAAAGPALPVNTFSNASVPGSDVPLYVLMLDSLDTPVATQSIVRQNMVEFVDKVPAGTRFAVFSLSAAGQLTLVQGFSSDAALLKKSIKSHKFDVQIPSLEDGGQDPATNTSMDMTKMNKRTEKPEPTEKIDMNQECNHAAAREQYTVSAMMEIARYLSGVPGRKNLIWYSGGFPSRMKDKQGTICYESREDLRAMDGMMEHAHVHVYPVDPRALDIMAKEGPESRIARLQTQEHLMMEEIAAATNGKTFYNNNDLAGAATQAIDTGSNYYSMSYSPTNQVWDTRARRVSVQVDRPDVTLLYRKGYHAVEPGTTLSGRPVDKATPAQAAMMRGSLQPTEVLFHVTAVPAAATDATLAVGNKPDPKAMKPPYRHLTLLYNIDASGIEFDQGTDGNYQGKFEFAVNVFDPGNGKMINSNAMVAQPNLPADTYQSMLSGGVKVKQEIDLPATGEYILRVGVHDMTNDHVGAVEIPVSVIVAASHP